MIPPQEALPHGRRARLSPEVGVPLTRGTSSLYYEEETEGGD